jgi:electron transport complex protein RnfG
MATERKPAWQTMALVAGVSLGAALLITGAWQISHDRILQNERERLLANLGSVIDAPANTALDAVEISTSAIPASENILQLFAMLDGDRTVGWVYSGVAPDGYNGPIEFLIGLMPDGHIARIRIMRHRETPGLGDGIEAGRSDWLTQFEGRNTDNTPLWALQVDGGEFDSITAATISPRAAAAAFGAVVEYHATNASQVRDALREATQTATQSTQ